MEDARELAIGLLEHETGKFPGLDNLDTVEGLDELDGFDDAVDGINKFIDHPKEVPETMEDDHGVRFSIVFVMLEYLIQHVSAITQGPSSCTNGSRSVRDARAADSIRKPLKCV